MRQILIVMTLLVVAACSATGVPESGNNLPWQTYGKQMGEKGLIERSQQQLAQQSSFITDETYQAYKQGYEEGRKQYCSQNAAWLGSTGQPYRGVCDNIDPFFAQDYLSGAQSRSAGM